MRSSQEPVPTEAGPSYCKQHPHMTSAEREHCENKSPTPSDLHHYEGLHSAGAGCAHCVEAFLAEGGDPHRGTPHRKKWNLVAWAEYSFKSGRISQEKLDAVRGVVSAWSHASLSSSGRLADQNCIRDDATGKEDVGMSVPSPSTATLGYCKQHPHMTSAEREHCENKSPTPSDLHHYEGLHSAGAGCAQCVEAFLAEGGDPHRGTPHRKKWNLVAWAEYSFKSGRISQEKLDAVRGVVSAWSHASLSSSGRLADQNCIRDDATGKEDVGMSVPSPSTATLGYCKQHPHMTSAEREHCENKSPTPSDLHHYEGLHSAGAGCAQCVEAFLAEGGDPHRGTPHRKKWNLVAWAEYSFKSGCISQEKLDAVRGVVSAWSHASLSSSGRLADQNCIRDDATGKEDVGMSVPSPSTATLGYCKQHPHMTSAEREHCENKSPTPSDLHHYEGLHSAGAGCAQCVEAFLAEGGDPHRGTPHRKKWNLVAWAEYSFKSGRISQEKLDAVRGVVSAWSHASLSSSGRLADQNCIRDDATGKEDVGMSVPSPSTATLGYCKQHPHMTSAEREHCENKSPTPSDLHHYEGLHSAGAGCAHCVEAFLAEGGDPHRGTPHRKKWNLVAWAEYSFKSGRISQEKLDAVRGVVAARMPTRGVPFLSSCFDLLSAFLKITTHPTHMTTTLSIRFANGPLCVRSRSTEFPHTVEA